MDINASLVKEAPIDKVLIKETSIIELNNNPIIESKHLLPSNINPKYKQGLTFNIKSQSDEIQRRHKEDIKLKLSYRVSAKETIDIKETIEKALKLSAAQKSFARKFVNPNSDIKRFKKIKKLLKIENKSNHKTIISRSVIINNHLQNAVKKKISSKCIEDYYLNEANLINLHHDKLKTAKEYALVFKSKEKAVFDKSMNMSELPINLKILHNVMNTIKENKNRSNPRSKSLNQQKINKKIASKFGSIHTKIIYKKENDQGIEEGKGREKRESHLIAIEDDTINKINIINNECRCEKNETFVDYNEPRNHRKLLLSISLQQKVQACDINQHNQESIEYFKRFNFPHEVFTSRLIKVKKELENDKTMHFQKQIFSNEQIDEIIHSKRHLKFDELQNYFYKKLYAEKNFIPQEFKRSVLSSSLSSPLSLPLLKINY